MTTARRSRLIIKGGAGLLWAITITAAAAEIPLKLFLVLWLATLLVSLLALATWLTRGDHGALAIARTQIELARLKGALEEEAEDRRPQQLHPETRVRSVA
ncbi:hypothetical protein Sme01_04260 [Sphaerisporangium melleum]|uniref:hypothetical protein n=1 Tax=Sphaerisporangium melleum TaxID=321316 RepID=UPI00166CA694|nr:hypothetical protein [Sphaerisporangium melleum]GII67950.1 hypothetical protein Sme01_04260 [Sphaerisporangium melleum]